VDHGRAVRVERALRIAGRARGVAEAGGAVLVEARPFERLALLADQFLVLLVHRHEVPDALQLRLELLDQRREGGVVEHHLVLGVIGDVGDLLGEEPRVDGVDHGAAAGDRVVDLVVPEAVPGEGGDAVVALHAELPQGVGEAAGARVRLSVGIAVDAALHRFRHDLGRAVMAVGMADQAADQQRHVHHQAVHDSSSGRG
jgi:hypothetical protein